MTRLSLTTLLGFLLLVGCDNPQKIEMQVSGQGFQQVLETHDLQGDGYSELFKTTHRKLFIYEHGDWLNSVCTEQVNFPADTLIPGNIGFLDVAGDEDKEIVLPVLRDGETYIRAFNLKGREVWRSDAVETFSKGSDGSRLPAVGAWSTIWDGRRRLLVYATGSGFREAPRQVGVVDLGTGKKLWHVELAPVPHSIVAGDILDELPGDEILIGTQAANNGVSVGNSDDTQSDVMLLSAAGQVLWRAKCGGRFSVVKVGFSDLDGDGAQEIYSFVYPGAEQDSRPILEVREPRCGRRVAFGSVPGGVPGGWAVLDLDRDGYEEFAVALSTGELMLLDHKVRLLRTVRVFKAPIVQMLVTDFEGDGSPELVCSSTREMVVLDRGLGVFARGPFPGGWMLVKGDGQGRHSIIVHDNTKHLWQATVVQPDIASRLRVLTAVALVVALAAVLSIPVMRRRWKAKQSAQPGAVWDRLLLEMQDLWHGSGPRNFLTELERSLRAASSPRAGEKSTGDPLEDSKRLARDFLGKSWPQVRRLEEMVSQHELVPSAEGRIPVPLPAEREAPLQRLAGGDTSPSNLERCVAEVQSLRQLLATIERALMDHFRSDLIGEIQNVLRGMLPSALSRGQAAGGVEGGRWDVRVSLKADAFPFVFIRPDDLRLVVRHLVENAVHAMCRSDQRRLDIEVKTNPIHTSVLIKDSGHGIEKASWEKIFAAGVTSKDGEHGRGLFLCRQRLMPFHGGLRVLESTVGVGTTFELRLRTVRPLGARAPRERDSSRRVGEPFHPIGRSADWGS